MASDRDLEQIVELVRGLSPQQRRQLVQRLRVSGLLPPQTGATDRNPLAKAPALGKRSAKASGMARGAREQAAAQSPVPSTEKPPAGAKEAERSPAGAPSAPLPLRFAGVSDAQGRRAGGKVVIGVPTGAGEADPHAMPPLPGQAPEQPIGLIFDGGSKGNPGIGYGSYALRWPGQPQQIVQLQFGDGVTNNEAEYDTLAAALEAVLKRLRDLKADAGTAKVEVRGDSQLVINQVLGVWKCNDDRMRQRRDRVRTLLREFGAWEILYHPRENNVRILGH